VITFCTCKLNLTHAIRIRFTCVHIESFVYCIFKLSVKLELEVLLFVPEEVIQSLFMVYYIGVFYVLQL